MPAEIWYPGAVKSPVALRDSQKVWITPVGTVDHTSVTDSTALRPTGTVRWSLYCSFSGKMTQFFPLNRPAACQRDGNLWRLADGTYRGFNSIETQDGAGRLWDGRDVRDCPPLTDDQIHAIAKFHAWQHNEFGIPIRLPKHCRETGFGYHSLFTASSGLRWNTTHACMTKTRNDQFPLILAEARRLASVPAPKPEDDDMPTAEEIAREVWEHHPSYAAASMGEYQVGTGIKLDHDKQRDADEEQRDAAEAALSNTVHGKLNALTEAVSQLRGIVDELNARARAR